MNKQDLVKEIKNRGPWFQRIEFPDYGITTTDDPDNAIFDGAPDNAVDGLSKEEACILRPTPKWRYIKEFLPDVSGMEVLEIGCNCGFFCFKFAELGAKKVVGVDIKKKWLENALWINSILGYKQVSFFNLDFFLLNNHLNDNLKTQNIRDNEIPLPKDKFDLIFSSTVINHMFFPFIALYKMLIMSRHYVVIDLKVRSANEKPDMTLYVRPAGKIHSFQFSEKLLVKMINHMGIDSDDIKIHRYNNNESITLVIKTTNYSSSLFAIDGEPPALIV